MKDFTFHENGIHLVLRLLDNGQIKLIHLSALPFREADLKGVDLSEGFQLCEVNFAGYNRPQEHQGNKMTSFTPGYRLQFRDLRDARNRNGRCLSVIESDAETGALVTTHMQFYDGIPVIRFFVDVRNTGAEPQVLDAVTTFRYAGIQKEGDLPKDDKMIIRVAHNNWQRECNWTCLRLDEVGLNTSQPSNRAEHSSGVFSVTNTGHWSAKEHLPMGCIENREAGTALLFQIEHNGSWHWEISDQNHHQYISAGGPDELHSHWWRTLQPGETFTTVPVAVSLERDFDRAMAALTRYRRVIRRPNADNENLPVIFNDYMNCLFGDPTTEKELPLIDAAAEAGCEYFVIDAGWYADGFWWDNVGEWKESKARFPNGLKEVTDYIRSKGMVPGVWLEIEVMGIHSPKLAETTPEWFFRRHGKPVYDRSRYQLDFRCPAVVRHADAVIDRLVRDYGIGYIKMDYNIEPGIGTEVHAESVGDGMFCHEQAYLAWLDRVFSRYPGLVIENCSSGGLRMDYAMLSRYSIQSTSDQEDYRYYSTIACNVPTGCNPEQAAVWSYPLPDGNEEEVIFNMINAMLLRIHQSGHLAEISPERLSLVREGLKTYKEIRGDIKKAVPFWPIGLAGFQDPWAVLGLRTDGHGYLAVWRRDGDQDAVRIPLADAKSVQKIYPATEDGLQYRLEEGNLCVQLAERFTARLFRIDFA